MNHFNKPLDILFEEKNEKLISTVTFEIEIPLVNYKDKGTLQKKYASRDTRTPVLVAKDKILKILKIKKLPLNLDITAFFKKQNSKNTIFTVHVDGADEKFLIKLLDSLND